MTRSAAPELSVNVRELLRTPAAHKHITVRAPLQGIATPWASVDPSRPVSVDAEVESVVEGLLVTGEVRAAAELECVRCLRPISTEVAASVQELFARRPDDAEDEGYAVLPDDRLPLDAMARDALVLALPPFPLCRPDCAGLCPQCGADRNDTDCGHASAPADSRWAALEAIDLRDAGEEPGGATEETRR